MKFPMMESLTIIAQQIDESVQNIIASIEDHPDRKTIIESADSVLGQLAAKLKDGSLNPAEADEYAQVYASLSLLANDNIRQNFKIDISTPEGKQKFARIVDNVGQDPGITAQLKKVATVNGQSHYADIKRDLEKFNSMDVQKQQSYINSINKLRIGYERVKTQLASNTAQPKSAPDQNTNTGGQSQSTPDSSSSSSANSASAPSTTLGSPTSNAGGM